MSLDEQQTDSLPSEQKLEKVYCNSANQGRLEDFVSAKRHVPIRIRALLPKTGSLTHTHVRLPSSGAGLHSLRVISSRSLVFSEQTGRLYLHAGVSYGYACHLPAFIWTYGHTCFLISPCKASHCGQARTTRCGGITLHMWRVVGV